MARDNPFDGKPGQKATYLVDPVDTTSIRDASLRRGSFRPDSASGYGPKKNDQESEILIVLILPSARQGDAKE